VYAELLADTEVSAGGEKERTKGKSEGPDISAEPLLFLS
jgi:hypothetical protein